MENAEERMHKAFEKLPEYKKESIFKIIKDTFLDPNFINHLEGWTEALKFEGLNLEPYLKQSGMTKTELAQQLEMSKGMLYNYINGNVKEPKLLVILAIRYLLDMPLDYLLKKGNNFFETGKSSAGYIVYEFDEMNHLMQTHERLTFEKRVDDNGLKTVVIKLKENNEMMDLKAGDYIVLKQIDKKTYMFPEDKEIFALIDKGYNSSNRTYTSLDKPFLTKVIRTISLEKDVSDGKVERSRHFIYKKDGQTMLTTQNKLVNMVSHVVIQSIKHY